MKKICLFIFSTMLLMASFAQDGTKKKLEFDKNKPVYELAAACGTCMFKMKGTGCALAVTYEGKNYFVAGTNIDDHGDAHDKNGFCNAIRKAKVQGAVVDDKFLVSYFELLKTTDKH